MVSLSLGSSDLQDSVRVRGGRAYHSVAVFITKTCWLGSQANRGGLPRISIPRTWVNKGKKKGPRLLDPGLSLKCACPFVGSLHCSGPSYLDPVVNVHCLGWLPLLGTWS